MSESESKSEKICEKLEVKFLHGNPPISLGILGTLPKLYKLKLNYYKCDNTTHGINPSKTTIDEISGIYDTLDQIMNSHDILFEHL